MDLPESSDCRASGSPVTRQILDRVGDKWSLLILFRLRREPRRFNELRREIDGISQRMLTFTLRGLERDGLIARTVHQSIPPRVDYQLTELGRTLLEPVMALAAWADRNRLAIMDSQRRFDDEAVPARPSTGLVVHRLR